MKPFPARLPTTHPAAEHLPPCTPADPVAGRAGLVGTQNIRNNESRVGGLDTVATTGTIVEAVDNQPWSGEANVHVSIANWVNTRDAALLPDKRRLWFKVEPSKATKALWKKQGKLASKEYELNFREVPAINSSLSDKIDVSVAGALACNTEPQRCFNGQMHGHAGFSLTAAERAAIIASDPRSAEVIHPCLNGVEVLTKGGAGERFVIDFEHRDQLAAAGYSGAFARVRDKVLPDRERKAEEGRDAAGKVRSHHKGFLSYWWRLSFGRPEMLAVIKPLPRYLACSYVTKRPVFLFISGAFRPSNLIQVFAFADDYSFGILQSHTHWLWFINKCGKLNERPRYSAESVYDTFPWPQSPDAKTVAAVAEAGRKVRAIRDAALPGTTGGLRALYRTLELPGKNPLKDAHAALDAAVLAAYGFSAKDDLLAKLLALNATVAARIHSGHTVTAPGLPPGTPNPTSYLTPDCIRPT